MSEKVYVKKGLEGVVVDTTRVAKVIPEINSLVYRGYPVQELCEVCNYLEVAYLLIFGELPTASQLKEWKSQEKAQRAISPELTKLIAGMPKAAHPMDVVRTAVSYIGMEDPRIWDADEATNQSKALSLLAKIPTVIAADIRRRKGESALSPDSSLGFSENFFKMAFGSVPKPEVLKAFDVSLILYAEHSFNASTFASRVITSTLSDLYSAVVGGIGALKGPLHGGANEQVMYMLQEVGEPQKAREWMLTALKEKRKIMGFGHRVYKNGDSRVPTMKKYTMRMAEITGQMKWMEIANELEATMVEQKGIYPNLDFPAGPAYFMMGFEIDMFTPIFVMSRIAGWSAHILEQTASNRLIRPLSDYEGPGERRVPSLQART